MTSKAERIADALHAALSSPAMTSVPPARVFRDLHGALQSELLPAIAIETGDEPEPVRAVIGAKERVVDVRVTVLASGSYLAADAALVEAFARVMADPTLGGLVFEADEGQTRRDREEGERQLVAVTKTWRCQYRTADDSLEA